MPDVDMMAADTLERDIYFGNTFFELQPGQFVLGSSALFKIFKARAVGMLC